MEFLSLIFYSYLLFNVQLLVREVGKYIFYYEVKTTFVLRVFSYVDKPDWEFTYSLRYSTCRCTIQPHCMLNQNDTYMSYSWRLLLTFITYTLTSCAVA